MILTLKDVSLLELFSGGSLAKSPEVKKKKQKKRRSIFTPFHHFVIQAISRTKIQEMICFLQEILSLVYSMGKEQ